MIIVFGVYGFDEETVRLQPWLTIREVGMRLAGYGWQVHVITDAANKNPELDGIKIHRVASLRQTNSDEVVRLITSINPTKLILLSSPLNLVGGGWLGKVSCDIYAFLSYPFYTRSELLKAMPFLIRQDALSFGRYLLLPNYLWGRTLKRYFRGLIAQSGRTVKRVSDSAGSSLLQHNISAGIDLDFWVLKNKMNRDSDSVISFLYVGSAKSIRGFDLLLKSFNRLDSQTAQLKILARGSNEAEELQLRSYVNKIVTTKHDRVMLRGGWIDKESLRDEIQQADCVVLPFVLVPSELPVSVIECIACGTPVITTDINGLPEAVGTAGIIIKQASIKALIGAMDGVCSSRILLNKLTEQCVTRRKAMCGWDEVASQWNEALT